MSFLLRRTKCNKWLSDEPYWLEEGEIPADPIFGLDTRNNSMSVWVIDSFEGKLERIIAALAATRDSLQDFEYVLLDSKTLALVGIKSLQTKGESPDRELNSLHLDLVEISGQKLLKLTTATLRRIQQQGEDTKLIDRVLRKTVAQYIVEGIRQGYLCPEDANAKVLEKAQCLVESSTKHHP